MVFLVRRLLLTKIFCGFKPKRRISIEGICKGEHELTISHPNCKVITVKIDIPHSGLKKIYLEHHITELEEIIVSTNLNKKESPTSIEDAIDREKYLTSNQKILVMY